MTTSGSGEIKVKTTKTVFSIIEFLQQNDGATLNQLADETGLAKSSVHNHVDTLKNLGYVVEENRIYYPGFRFIQVGNYVRNRKPEYDVIREKVDNLARDTGERCLFIISQNGLGTCVYTASGEKAVRTEPQLGTQVYLHSSAAGKAVLAHLPESRIKDTIDRWGLPRLTENTITEYEELLDELEGIRQRGYAFNREENLEGLHAIGAPLIYEEKHIYGALSVMGPTHRLVGDVFTDELPQLLMGVTNEIDLNIRAGV